MNFLISLIISIILVSIGRNFIKKYANICYILTTILSTFLVIGSYTGIVWTLPSWFTTTILPIFIKSTFSTAIFVIVMYTGAFKNGSKLIKFLMPIRTELSIIAGILTLAHNISFGRYYFLALFTRPETITTNMKAAAGISIVLIIIMVPLLITSFPIVRKLMKPIYWKRLQRLAYIFYALVYAHVMVIMVPVALMGDMTYIINVLVYSIVFITYAIMRIHKFLAKRFLNKRKEFSSVYIAN